jgi:hypothetical protein
MLYIIYVHGYHITKHHYNPNLSLLYLLVLQHLKYQYLSNSANLYSNPDHSRINFLLIVCNKWEYVLVCLFNMLYLFTMTYISNRITKLLLHTSIKNMERSPNRYSAILVSYHRILILVVIKQIVVSISVIFNQLYMVIMDYIGKLNPLMLVCKDLKLLTTNSGILHRDNKIIKIKIRVIQWLVIKLLVKWGIF